MRRRSLGCEQLETRSLLAVDFDSACDCDIFNQELNASVEKHLRNYSNPNDVDNDGLVTRKDAETILKHLWEPNSTDGGFVDTNGDGMVSAVDLLVVVEAITKASAEGHGNDGHSLNEVARHHMMEHDIPDFTANPTHIISESGEWSKISKLSGVNRDSVVVIEEGANVVFDMTGVRVKSLGIYGKLSFRTDINTSLTVQEILVHGSGYLEIGTEANPVRRGVSAKVSIGDRPLDTTTDPTQAGNGILVLGKIVVHGESLASTHVSLQRSPAVGDLSVLVSNVPSGWKIGDRIAIPQTVARADAPLSEEFQIAFIRGNEIGITAPLRYDRPSAINANGISITQGFDGSDLRGYVANLSRNVIFTSENPAGNRGHFMLIGNAHVDIQYAAFEGLGRTSLVNINNTEFDEDGKVDRIGSNQIGRYAFHLHHVWGPEKTGVFVDNVLGQRQFRVVGNSIYNGMKWGLVIHESHYGLVDGNVITGVQGAGVVTETGGESFNMIRGNFSFAIATDVKVFARDDLQGRHGVGFWMAGTRNDFVDNVAAAVNEGFSFRILATKTRSPVDPKVPLFAGASTLHANQYQVKPVRSLEFLRFDGNESFGTRLIGFGIWAGNVLPNAIKINQLTMWNFANKGVFLDYSTVQIDGLIAIGAPKTTSLAIDVHYAIHNVSEHLLSVTNFNVQNVTVLVNDDSRPILNARFSDGVAAQSEHTVIHAYQTDNRDKKFIFDKVKWEAVAGGSLKTIRAVLTAADDFGISLNPSHNNPRFINSMLVIVLNHQGILGNNFQVFVDQQMPDFLWTEYFDGADYSTRLASNDYVLDNGKRKSILNAHISMGAFHGQQMTTAEMWDKYRVTPLSAVAWNANYTDQPDFPSPTSKLGSQLPEFERVPLPHFQFASGRAVVATMQSTVELRLENEDLAFARMNGAELMRFRVDNGNWFVVPLTQRVDRVNLPINALTEGAQTIFSQFGTLDGQWWGVTGSQLLYVRD
jgi:G8 domain/Dockerin type I domain